MSEREPLFSLEGVRCILGNQTIPNETGWTVEIERGCRLAVLGRSGSGKTTFLHVLGLLSPLSHGTVTYRPRDREPVAYGDLYGGDPDRLRQIRGQRFGFVFQSDHLLDNLSTEHNLALPLLLRGSDREQAAARARKYAQRFFEAGELTDLLKRNPSDLSGGQRSRIALLRGLIIDPEVLFLDEPFTYLDNAQVKRANRWLKEWQMEGADGRTIVMVSHHLEQTAEIGTHFLVIAPDRRVIYNSAAKLGGFKERLEWLKGILPDEPDADKP